MLPTTLEPSTALVIFIIACLAGFQYRRVWKAEGPLWQKWLWGVIAGVCLLFVALIPLNVS